MKHTQPPTKNFYDKNAKWWSENKTNSFWHEKQFQKFIRHFKKGDEILDIGSASGIHVPLFLGIGSHLKYEGMDISSEMVKIARRRYPQLKFLKADILDAKTLPRKKYSGFWAGAVLMHTSEKDWPQMTKNIERIVKKGGVGYMTLPRKRPNMKSKKDPRYFSLWTPQKLERFLKKRGWKILAQGKMPKRYARWFWTIVRLPSS